MAQQAKEKIKYMNLQKKLRKLIIGIEEVRLDLASLAEDSEQEVTPMSIGFAIGLICRDLDIIADDVRVLKKNSEKMITSTVDEEIATMFKTGYQLEDDDDDLDEDGMDAEDRDEMNRIIDKD